MIKRTIYCSVCGAHCREDHEGAGFPNWGQLHGIVLDGDANPHLCPVCIGKAAAYLDGLKKEAP